MFKPKASEIVGSDPDFLKILYVEKIINIHYYYWVCFFLPVLRSRSRKEPGAFGPLDPEPLEKKNRSRSRSKQKKIKSIRKLYICGAAWGKKPGAGAAWQNIREPAPQL